MELERVRRKAEDHFYEYNNHIGNDMVYGEICEAFETLNRKVHTFVETCYKERNTNVT